VILSRSLHEILEELDAGGPPPLEADVRDVDMRAHPQARAMAHRVKGGVAINVKTARLDDVIPEGRAITLVKVDVEGAELQVFLGGLLTLARYKPFVIFEHGEGAAAYYGTTPGAVYDVLAGQCGLRLNLMAGWLRGARPFTRSAFIDQCRRDFHSLAHP
jgi:hypothetical protein